MTIGDPLVKGTAMERATTEQMWGASSEVAAIVAFASAGGPRVLVIGSGRTELLEALTASGKTTVQASLDDDDGAPYDVIVVPSVGSLADPAAILADLAGGSRLTDSGFLVLAAWNAAHHAVVRALDAGHTPSAPEGHASAGTRLYTRQSLLLLCESEGLAVTKVRRVITGDDRFETSDASRARSSRVTVAEQLDRLASSYVLRAEPSESSATSAALRLMLLEERIAHTTALREVTATRAELDAITEQRDSLLAHYTWARAELERQNYDQKALDQRFIDLVDALDGVRRELTALSGEPVPATTHTNGDEVADDVSAVVELLEFELARIRGVLQSAVAVDDRTATLEDALAEAHASLQAIFRSETWKIARLLTAIPAAVRRRIT